MKGKVERRGGDCLGLATVFSVVGDLRRPARRRVDAVVGGGGRGVIRPSRSLLVHHRAQRIIITSFYDPDAAWRGLA